MKFRIWIASIVGLIVLCSGLFYFFYTAERTEAISVVVTQQRTLARQAAKSLSQLVSKWNSVLSYLSADRDIVAMNAQGEEMLSELREVLKNEVKSITRTDRTGTIVYTTPYFPNSIGRNISQQKHMMKAMASHEPVVSDVFDAVQGFQAIAIHYPIFKNGAFDGTLALVIDFGRVGKTILDDIGSNSSEYAWLLSGEGVELYCPVPGHVGRFVRETSEGFPELLQVVDSMLAGKEGSGTYAYNMVGNRKSMVRKIVYYLPVPINDTYWSLAIAYSEDEITKTLQSYSAQLILVIGCLFFGGVVISYFGIRAWVVVKESNARNHAELQLRESEERYRTLYNNAVIGIYRMSSQGSILFANPHFVRMLGFQSFEELSAFTKSETGSAFKSRSLGFDTMLQGEQEVRGLEWKWQKRDGTEIFIRENVRVSYEDDGSVAHYDIIAEDISEPKRLQAHLLQSQKMEAIGQLAGGVAHDFNNMIGVILGYATLIKESLKPADPSASKVEAIIVASGRAAELSKQLLAFARRQVITPIVLNLNTELVSIRKMLGRLIGENIELRLVLDEKLWNIKYDPIQIDQIVTNLCTNARDAISNVGTITVETSNIILLSETQGMGPGEYVVMKVTDTGDGMDQGTIERIFEPFFTTKPKGKGTGLGLSTVFGIVKQNNGQIEVASEKGKGTTFTLYFQRDEGTLDNREEIPDANSLRGEGNVLVVEDEQQLLDLIGSTLQEHGYTPRCTNSPSKALELCSEFDGKLDLLITDVIMPEMNGKELQGRIESVYPGTKTLFISGYTADVVAERGILEKETFFLQKPFTPNTLLKKVRSVMADA